MKTTWAPTSRGPVAGGFPSSHLSPGRLQGLRPLPGPFFQACSCHRKQTRLKPLFQQNKRACERTTRWLLRGPTVYLSPRWPHLVFWKRESRASIQALPYCTLDTAPDPSLRPHPRLPEWFPESLQQTCERRGRACRPCGDRGMRRAGTASSIHTALWAPTRPPRLHKTAVFLSSAGPGCGGERGAHPAAPRSLCSWKLLGGGACWQDNQVQVLSAATPGWDPRTAHRAPLEGQEQAGEKPPVVPALPQLTRTQAASPCRSPAQSARHGASWWAVGPATRCWTGLC